jgi:hypothetical protein
MPHCHKDFYLTPWDEGVVNKEDLDIIRDFRSLTKEQQKHVMALISRLTTVQLDLVGDADMSVKSEKPRYKNQALELF